MPTPMRYYAAFGRSTQSDLNNTSNDHSAVVACVIKGRLRERGQLSHPSLRGR